MLLAFAIMGLYLVGVIAVGVVFHYRPPTPDPTITAIRVNEYLTVGRR